MKVEIPRDMKALQITDYHNDIKTALNNLRIVKKPVPKPSHGQVLIKIEAAPCNPSDLLFLQGRYGVKKPLPTVPGWEGAGVVVATGGGLIGRWLLGKRVACAGQSPRDGTWSEYYITEASSCIPLKDKISMDQGASLIINPFTTFGMLDIAKREHHSAIIQTGAASQVGRMVLNLAKKEGIRVINIVRREEQKVLLGGMGADCVLNSEDSDFRTQLKVEASRCNATIAFDAVAGEMTGLLLSAMPSNSKILVYGALSGASCSGISPIDLIFSCKSVEGFWLTKWINGKNFVGMYLAAHEVQNLVLEGVIHTAVHTHARLDEAPEALEAYHKEMTLGKVIITPNH